MALCAQRVAEPWVEMTKGEMKEKIELESMIGIHKGIVSPMNRIHGRELKRQLLSEMLDFNWPLFLGHA